MNNSIDVTICVITTARSKNIFRQTKFVSEDSSQRTNGPVEVHLISWPSKAQNIQNLKIYGKEMILTFITVLHNLN